MLVATRPGVSTRRVHTCILAILDLTDINSHIRVACSSCPLSRITHSTEVRHLPTFYWHAHYIVAPYLGTLNNQSYYTQLSSVFRLLHTLVISTQILAGKSCRSPPDLPDK